ncbi:MAG: cobalamin-dependent protein [Defluviitaleaceae bacterium]|nr:cobalamin-dependent protein [Defluviitaleaceae bacterium]
MSICTQISELVQKGKAKLVKEEVAKAIESGVPVADILNEGLLAAMGIVGEKFKNNQVYVPEMLVAARAMNAGMEILKPHLVEAGVEPIGKVILGTVAGDLHDIGKNLVKLMLEGKGIEVVDLGIDVPAEKFVEAYNEHGSSLILLSALLTTTMGEMKNVIEAFAKAGLRDKVKFMIGGAPITETFKNEIGAEYYTADAATAASLAKEIITAA